MKYYFELTLMDNEQLGLYQLWAQLLTQIHLAFVEEKDQQNQIEYGVSFPEYRREEKNGKTYSTLGSKLRIFGKSEEALNQLNLTKAIERLTDYVHLKSIQSVPSNATSLCTVKRYKPKHSTPALARRYAKRHNINYEQALNRLEGRDPQWENYPYVQIKSLSTQQSLSLCIQQDEAHHPKEGKFSTYGLSATSTVPHW